MTIVSVASVRGAPGVTTTALLLAGAIPDAVLVEADLAGGVMAIRYGLGREPGLTTFAADRGVEPGWWRAHAQDAGGVAVLVGPDAPEHAEGLWRRAGDRLAGALGAIDGVVVVDVGRLGSASPLLAESDVVIVVVRPIAEQLVVFGHRLESLRRVAGSARLGVVLVGRGPYRPVDVGPPLGVEVIAELPDDPRAAAMLVEGGRSTAAFARTRLARAAAGLHLGLPAPARGDLAGVER